MRVCVCVCVCWGGNQDQEKRALWGVGLCLCLWVVVWGAGPRPAFHPPTVPALQRGQPLTALSLSLLSSASLTWQLSAAAPRYGPLFLLPAPNPMLPSRAGSP